MINGARRQHDPGTAKFAQPPVNSEADAVLEPMRLKHGTERYAAASRSECRVISVRHSAAFASASPPDPTVLACQFAHFPRPGGLVHAIAFIVRALRRAPIASATIGTDRSMDLPSRSDDCFVEAAHQIEGVTGGRTQPRSSTGSEMLPFESNTYGSRQRPRRLAWFSTGIEGGRSRERHASGPEPGSPAHGAACCREAFRMSGVDRGQQCPTAAPNGARSARTLHQHSGARSRSAGSSRRRRG